MGAVFLVGRPLSSTRSVTRNPPECTAFSDRAFPHAPSLLPRSRPAMAGSYAATALMVDLGWSRRIRDVLGLVWPRHWILAAVV